MPGGRVAEHDQRFKTLLKEFFREFLDLFFREHAAGLDLSRVEWLDKEMLPDPPQGDVAVLDLVAKVARQVEDGSAEPTLALIHTEVESRDSVLPFRKRMFDYYHYLRRTYQLPVLPLAVYMRVGLDGLGLDTYTESFGGLEVVRFQFPYVGLPALDAVRYLQGTNWLGVALAALMRIERERKVWLRAELLRRVLVECGENIYRKFLLTECVEAYLGMDEEQQRQFERMLREEQYREVLPMMTTTFEKGLIQGRQEGVLLGQRQMLRVLLEHKFGNLSPVALQRLEAWPAERLAELSLSVLGNKSLKELGLED
jgi:hypothetical protein